MSWRRDLLREEGGHAVRRLSVAANREGFLARSHRCRRDVAGRKKFPWYSEAWVRLSLSSGGPLGRQVSFITGAGRCPGEPQGILTVPFGWTVPDPPPDRRPRRASSVL